MAPSRIFLRAWIALLSLAIFAMPLGGAHLHVCLDGKEAPASVHATGDGIHHAGEGAGTAHQDFDVSLAGSALAKKFDEGAADLPVLMTAAFVLFWAPAAVSVVIPRDTRSPLAATPPSRILPPLRGPPV